MDTESAIGSLSRGVACSKNVHSDWKMGAPGEN